MPAANRLGRIERGRRTSGAVLTVNPDGSADFETPTRPWPALVLERKLER
jgi:hypothetical protein